MLVENTVFGEGGLLPGAVSESSYVALTNVSCMSISRATVERVMGPLQSLIDEARRKAADLEQRRQMALEADGLHKAVLGDFLVVASGPAIVSDTGAMLLVKHSETGKAYAARIESKGGRELEGSLSALVEEIGGPTLSLACHAYQVCPLLGLADAPLPTPRPRRSFQWVGAQPSKQPIVALLMLWRDTGRARSCVRYPHTHAPTTRAPQIGSESLTSLRPAAACRPFAT